MENVYQKHKVNMKPNFFDGSKVLSKGARLCYPLQAFSGEGGSPNDTLPAYLYVTSVIKEDGLTFPGQVIYAVIHNNGVIGLHHHGFITHKVRKLMNMLLPPTVRVIQRKKKFFIVDEEGVRHPFPDCSVLISQGKVYPCYGGHDGFTT